VYHETLICIVIGMALLRVWTMSWLDSISHIFWLGRYIFRK